MVRTLRGTSAFFTLLLFFFVALPSATSAANNPVPLINNPLAPFTVAPGGADFTLTVNGSNFVAGSVVKWNRSTALPTTFVSSSQLTALVSHSLIATAGSASITVTNPSPGGGTSLPAYLRIAAAATSPSFVSYTQGVFNGTISASSMITGDFNSDGKLDLAFVEDSKPSGTDVTSICISLGNGDGSFQTPACQQAATGRFFTSFVAGDFNGDGKLDLAVANEPNPTGNGVVSIYLGNGDGTLGSPIDSPSGNGPLNLVAADFDRDGKLDLAIVNFIEGSTSNTSFVAVLVGNGDGTFQTPVNYASGLNAWTITVGDFNRDGNLDLVFSSVVGGTPPTTVYFMAGNGDGTFLSAQAGHTIQAGDTIASAVDIDGDGKLDLLLGSNSVLLGNGDGTFQAQTTSNAPSPGNTVCPAGALDDINADGKLDWSFCAGDASVPPGVGFQPGNGDGTFGTASNFSIPTTDIIYLTSIVSGDFNGDGRVDVITTLQNHEGSASLLAYLQGSFPVVSPSLSSLNFPVQAVGSTSGPQAITLTNTGTISVTLSPFTFSGASAASFGQTNNCSSTLAGGASCQINVTFDPATPGSAVATMNIASSAVNNPSTISLTGSTLGPAATLSPTSVTFPSQYVGTSGNPQSVTVTNTGTATLNITNVAASPSDFATLNACGSSLAAGASCAIGVFFDPTAGGTRTGTLTITDNAGTPQTVALSGSGQDFSMTSGAASSATVSAGQTANYSISVAPAGGFAQSVALTCSGGPVGSTCALSPSTVTLGGSTAQTVKVSVSTVASSSIPSIVTWPTDRKFPTPLFELFVRIFLVLGVIATFGTSLRRWQRRLRWAPAFVLALIAVVCLGLTSCGGSGNNGGGMTPLSKSYTVTVSGNFATGATTITHNTQLTLVVQ